MTFKQSTTLFTLFFCFLFSASTFGQFKMNAVVSEPDANTTHVQYTVCDFTAMVSMQFSFQYDADLISYSAATDLNLAGLGFANIGDPSPGNITLSWVADDIGNGETIDDCTSIVTLVFDGVGTTDADYSFSGTPTEIEFSNTSGVFNPDLSVEPCACGPVDGLQNFDLDDGLNITVSPNPISDFANIEIEGSLITSGQFRLMNIAGQEVLRQSFSGNAITLEATDLANGTYLFTVYDNGTLVGVKKLIIR